MTIALMVLAATGLVVLLSAWGDVRQAIIGARWLPLLLAFLATCATYAVIGVRFAAISWAVRIRAPFRLLVELGYVSTLLGRVVVGGGTAGILLRVVTLRRRAVPVPAATAAAIFHSYASFLLAILVLAAAVAYAAATGSLGIVQAGAAVAAALLVGCAAAIAAALFSRRVRDRLTAGVIRLLVKLTKRDFSAEGQRFAGIMDKSASVARRRPILSAMTALLLALETVAALTALWLCFDAVGTPLGAGTLLVGFGVGVAVGMVSMIPGGLGVQEGSMAGVYSLLGVPLDQAVAATALFRGVHYFAPFLASLVLYRGLLTTQETAAGDSG